MQRNEFLKILGTGTLLACAGCLDSCSSKGTDPLPVNVDFILDLTLPENAALTNVGGSVSKNGVIVVKFSASEFVALSQACTHQGTAINYQSSQQNFLCPNHLSKFDKNGGVINGPASSALHKYNTELTSTNLRVFS